MSEASTIAAPTIDEYPRNKWRREYEAFHRLLPTLLPTHRGQFVLIHEGHVADSGPDDVALALRFFDRQGNVPIHIGLVTDQALPILRVPHYRVLGQSRASP